MKTSLKLPLYPRFCASLGWVLSLAGCGSQAGTDYHGDPMLTLKGSAVIKNEHAPTELVPTIGFYTNKENDLDGMYFMDAEVSGAFPANFTLSVLHPPPADVLWTKQESASSRFATGYTTAAPPDHPAFVSLPGEGACGCRNALTPTWSRRSRSRPASRSSPAGGFEGVRFGE